MTRDAKMSFLNPRRIKKAWTALIIAQLLRTPVKNGPILSVAIASIKMFR